MISEYVSIFMTGTVILLFRTAPLHLPLEYYLNQDHLDVFNGNVDLGPLRISLAWQLVAEVLVDTFCTVFEERRRYPLTMVWKDRPRMLIPILLAACSYGAAVSMAMTDKQDNMDNCRFIDMCYCFEDGLREGSLRSTYVSASSNKGFCQSSKRLSIKTSLLVQP
jgi:hypothetical protein